MRLCLKPKYEKPPSLDRMVEIFEVIFDHNYIDKCVFLKITS